MQLATKLLAIAFCGVAFAQSVTPPNFFMVAAAGNLTPSERKEMGMKPHPNSAELAKLYEWLSKLSWKQTESVQEVEQQHRAETNAAMLFSGYTCGMIHAVRSSDTQEQMRQAALDSGIDCGKVDGLIEKMSAEMR